MALDDDLRRLAALQHSVIARRQARALGASASALRRRVRGPDWEAMTPAVLRLRGSRHSDGQRAMAAVLFDLAGTLHPKRVERAIENAWSEHLVDGRALVAMLDDMAGRGRRRWCVRSISVVSHGSGGVDFLNREETLVVQIDSERHHSALIDKRADDAQTAAMEDAGFMVLRFTDTEVWYHGDKVVAELRRARTGHRKPRPSA